MGTVCVLSALIHFHGGQFVWSRWSRSGRTRNNRNDSQTLENAGCGARWKFSLLWSALLLAARGRPAPPESARLGPPGGFLDLSRNLRPAGFSGPKQTIMLFWQRFETGRHHSIRPERPSFPGDSRSHRRSHWMTFASLNFGTARRSAVFQKRSRISRSKGMNFPSRFRIMETNPGVWPKGMADRSDFTLIEC